MGFTIRDIPAVMRAKSWTVGAQLMDRWFARRAAKMTDADKRGDTCWYDVETKLVTMTWAQGFPRVMEQQRHLLRAWNTSRARQLLEYRIRSWPGFSRQPISFRFGNLFSTTANIDRTCQINRDIIESNYISDPIDDFYVALGDATMKLAVSGVVARGPRGRMRITIDQVGTYIRDTYDFTDSPWFSQPLGQWRASGVTRSEILAPAIPISSSEAKDDINQYYSVSNASFDQYRARYKQGGDFVILSDVVRTRLTRPVVIDFD